MAHKIITLSGVSGVGKTTLINLLIQNHNFKNSISYTTRAIRNTEINGENYHFITKKQFKNAIIDGFFVEYDQIFDHYYGTAKNTILELLKTNNVAMTLSTTGYKNLKTLLKDQLIGIYLLPPNQEELIKRIKERNTSKEELEIRIKNIFEESEKDSGIFEHTIAPKNLTDSLKTILEIFNNFK